MPFLAVAAIVAGGAVAAGAVAASTVLYAGLAATVVGKVTKSKELTQIGTGMSLGAGLASAATSIFGAAEGASATAGAGGAMSAENAALGGADGMGGIDATAGTLDAASGADAASSGIQAATSGSGVTEGLDAASKGVDAASGAGQSSGGLLTPSNASAPLTATPAPVATAAPSAATATPFESGFVGSDVALAPPPAGGIQQWWAKLSPLDKAKMVSGGADAAMKYWDASQRNEFEREKFNLTQQQYNTSVSNANAQPQVAFKKYSPTQGLLSPSKG